MIAFSRRSRDEDQQTSVAKLKILCQKLPCCNENEAIDEWTLFSKDESIPKEWENSPADEYWATLSNLVGGPKYNIITQVMKCALTLALGNADTERSLSQIKKVLTKEKTALSPKTLIGIRLVQDAVRIVGDGDPSRVTLMSNMLKQCKGAYAAYEVVIKQKREQELQDKKAEKQRKLESKHKEEEEKKRQREVKNIRSKNKEVDTEIMNIVEGFKHAENLAMESSARMQKAIKNKDLQV